MNDLLTASKNQGENGPVASAHLVLALFALIAPVFSFLIAVSAYSMDVKTAALGGLAVVYGALCYWSFRRIRAFQQNAVERNDADRPRPIELLGEAKEFFGSSLSPEDMFRLVCSRIEPLFPFDAALLLMPSESDGELCIREYFHKDGKIAEIEPGRQFIGAARLAFLSGDVEIDSDADEIYRDILVSERSERVSVNAVPMKHNAEPFAVFVLLAKGEPKSDRDQKAFLRDLGAQIEPLFLGALSRESSLSNALTDPVTGLPNERAFFMILENQIAESQRFRDERPLSVVAIDLKGFEDINRELGHSTGDEILRFTAERLLGLIRKMDFLARSQTDEFLILLPRLSETGADEVVKRIKEQFAAMTFAIDEHQQVPIYLNFGTACFWRDGETPKQIMNHAVLIKAQSKSETGENVYWFSKDYVN